MNSFDTLYTSYKKDFIQNQSNLPIKSFILFLLNSNVDYSFVSKVLIKEKTDINEITDIIKCYIKENKLTLEILSIFIDYSYNILENNIFISNINKSVSLLYYLFYNINDYKDLLFSLLNKYNNSFLTFKVFFNHFIDVVFALLNVRQTKIKTDTNPVSYIFSKGFYKLKIFTDLLKNYKMKNEYILFPNKNEFIGEVYNIEQQYINKPLNYYICNHYYYKELIEYFIKINNINYVNEEHNLLYYLIFNKNKNDEKYECITLLKQHLNLDNETFETFNTLDNSIKNKLIDKKILTLEETHRLFPKSENMNIININQLLSNNNIQNTNYLIQLLQYIHKNISDNIILCLHNNELYLCFLNKKS